MLRQHPKALHPSHHLMSPLRRTTNNLRQLLISHRTMNPKRVVNPPSPFGNKVIRTDNHIEFALPSHCFKDIQFTVSCCVSCLCRAKGSVSRAQHARQTPDQQTKPPGPYAADPHALLPPP